MSIQARQPAGSPVGGQFSAMARPEAEFALDEDTAPAWGEAFLSVGSRTPWGEAQQIDRVADGIVFASTASHGGIKLSPERNKEIPAILRKKSGWYEEDVEAAIPAAVFADAFAETNVRGTHPILIEARAKQTIRDYMPDEYEKWTGEDILPGQSRTRDRIASEKTIAERRKAMENEFVEQSYGGSFEGIPDRMEVVRTWKASTSEEQFRMTHREGTADNPFPRVLDDSNSVDVSHIMNMRFKDRPTARPATVDMSQLTAAGRVRAETELGKRFRFAEGTMTMREHLETVPLVNRHIAVDNKGRTQHLVGYPDGTSIEVPKAIFDSIPGTPDTTPTTTWAYGVHIRAQIALDRAKAGNHRGTVTSEALMAAHVKAEKSSQEYSAAYEAELREDSARRARLAARQKAAFQELTQSTYCWS